jgi:hypothetical protein
MRTLHCNSDHYGPVKVAVGIENGWRKFLYPTETLLRFRAYPARMVLVWVPSAPASARRTISTTSWFPDVEIRESHREIMRLRR